MCPPAALPPLAGSRSWACEDSSPLDPVLAIEQWQCLVAIVEEQIAPVITLAPEPWAPAMTFVRDLALSTAEAFIPLRPRGVRGAFEAPLLARALDRHRIRRRRAIDPRPAIAGGNLLADRHGRLLVGVAGMASPELRTSVAQLAQATSRLAFRAPLPGGHFPHLDMVLCDLGGRGWLVHPGAWPGVDLATAGWHELFRGQPVIQVGTADAELLGCNLVVGDEVVIGPSVSHKLAGEIRRLGFAYHACDLGELRKAGGGAHCLTLELYD